MSIQKVKDYFSQFGITDRIMEFDSSSATVQLAAQALNVQPARIAKTLAFAVSDAVIVIVMAGDAKIDNARYKARFKTKAKMLTPDDVLQKTGHEVGGVCPFALPDGVKVCLDESLKRFSTVFPACGSANSAIELTVEQLEKYSRFDCWVDVTFLS